MPNFFERASAGLNSLINDATIRARAAKSTTSALGKVGGEFGERLGRALQHAATLSRKNRELETDELCDLQVGANCYADSPGFMRTQLWESLLDRAEREGGHGLASSSDGAEGDILDDMAAVLTADGGYYEVLREAFEAKSERARVAETSAGDGACVKASKGWDENVGAAIERDLSRTFPNHEFFAAATTKGADGTTEKRPFVLHYFLADDTVEILEVAQPNSGRDPWPALLKRIKLPKATRSRGVGAAAASALVAYQWLSAHRSLEH